MSTAIEEKKAKVVVIPFAIEINTANNSDVLLNSIPGCRLRSSFTSKRGVRDFLTGDEGIPQDWTIGYGGIPDIPGMELHVDPAKCTYKVIDPLCDDEALLERIRKHIEKNSAFKTDRKLNGVPTLEGSLDIDRMKTLCREMLTLLDSDDARMAEGRKPKLEDVDKMPGNYLLNPGSQIQTMQPRYEKDFDEWVQRLARSGG